MVIDLARRFVITTRKKGIRASIRATKQYLRKRVKIGMLRVSTGKWSIVQEINGSKMKLDFHPSSSNEIEKTLAVDGVREPSATETFRDVLIELKKGHSTTIHVFDIGANIGYFALLEANILGEQGKICAIEAEPENTKRLKENINLNGYTNIDVMQVAIGSERTNSELSLELSANVHRMTEVLDRNEAGDTINVEVYPLDDLINEKVIPEDELIVVRLDVEGYERYVFQGMSGLLSSERPVYLFSEIHSDNDIVNVDKIVDTIGQASFEPEYISLDGGHSYQTMTSLDEIRTINANAHIMVSRL